MDRSHPIWHIEEKVPPEQQRPLLGIEFGCRTSVVYAPPDPPKDPRPSLSCLWELSRSGRQRHFTPAVQAQIDAARSIGINILAYATDREVQPTEEDFAAAPQPRHRMERGKIFIAKLRHPGDCDAAPDALVHLIETAMVALKSASISIRPSWTSPTRRCSTTTWSSCRAAPPSASPAGSGRD